MKNLGLSLMAIMLFMVCTISVKAQITSQQINQLVENTLQKFNVVGLGLSLSYDIIKAHGGELKVKTKEGKGTIFTIALNSNSKNI